MTGKVEQRGGGAGDHEGLDALELTITYRGGTPTVDLRRVRARALPTLDVAEDVPLPPNRLELLDGGGAVIYRRSFPRPGHVEVHGPRRRWAPAAMPQTLVALVPALTDARRVVADAVALGRWLDEALP